MSGRADFLGAGLRQAVLPVTADDEARSVVLCETGDDLPALLHVLGQTFSRTGEFLGRPLIFGQSPRAAIFSPKTGPNSVPQNTAPPARNVPST